MIIDNVLNQYTGELIDMALNQYTGELNRKHWRGVRILEYKASNEYKTSSRVLGVLTTLRESEWLIQLFCGDRTNIMTSWLHMTLAGWGNQYEDRLKKYR